MPSKLHTEYSDIRLFQPDFANQSGHLDIHFKSLSPADNRSSRNSVSRCHLQANVSSPSVMLMKASFLRIPSGLSPLVFLFGQVLDRLVTVSSTRYRASTPALSTSSSSRGLTNLRYGISYLEGGFTLRCLQRLSRPDLATRLCHWYDNRCTRGQSIPVLSY